MSRISLSLVPPGGWRFEQDGVTFEAQTFPDLFGMVGAHRHSNNKPMGNPWQEIQDQICQRNPDFCLDQKHMHSAPPTTFIDNLRSFATAAKNYILNGGALVDQNTANIRADTCLACHNNVPSSEARQAPGGCKTCGGGVDATLSLIRNLALAGRATPRDRDLKACLLCGCDLLLKIWMPVKYFDPKCEQGNKYPTFCWMKNCS